MKPLCVDLRSLDVRSLEEACEVCVVGAGAAGLYVACSLARKGRSVIILEAGAPRDGEAHSLGMDIQFTAEPYAGATLGRSFGLGGSTRRWGGVLIPHSKHDMRPAERDGFDAWRHVVSVVTRHTDAVLANLGLKHGADFFSLAASELGTTASILGSRGLHTLAAQYLPFRRRNLMYLLSGHGAVSRRAKVYYNAVAARWAAVAGQDGSSRITAVEARSPNGKVFRVCARHVVVAAGAIESARILLELAGSAVDRRLVPPSAAIGCYLSDHLSCPIADVATNDLSRATITFGPRFIDGQMWSFRFVDSSPPPGFPRWFAHFIFDLQTAAHALAKEVLLAMQSRRLPNITAKQLLLSMWGVVLLGFHRYARRRLFLPRGAPARLQLDIEQMPVRTNAVRLGAKIDRYGRRNVVVDWRVADIDYNNIEDVAARLFKLWPGRSAGLPHLVPLLDEAIGPKPYDAYHPVGTCRLGVDAESVVSPSLRVHGLDNLWVLSTGVLPSAGTANPTFTMLCLGEQMCNEIASLLNSWNARVTAA